MKPMTSCARITREPDRAECQERDRLWQLPICFEVPDRQVVEVSRGCAHNELLAFTNRVAYVDPNPSPDGVAMLRKLFTSKAKSMLSDMSIYPWSQQQVLKYYGENTPKASIFRRAYQELQHREVEPGDARITMFVKAEKLLAPETSAERNDPRAIQFRGPTFSAELARYTLALERQFYQHTEGATKGLDCHGKGRVLSELIQEFANPCFIELDCSRFDAHVSESLLKTEHHFYNVIFSSPKLVRLLRMQLKNKGYTRTGLKYQVTGKRMSGDMNTALGNNILQWGMISVWLNLYSIRYKFVFDGDDSVIVVEREDVHNIQASDYERMFGMKAKMKVLYDISDVEYCKGRFFGEVPNLLFSRDPMAALFKDAVTTKLLVTKSQLNNYMHTLGVCMSHQYDRVPVMWALANAIRKAYPFGKLDPTFSQQVKRGTAYEARPPLPEHRATLSWYGWSESEQINIERSLVVY